MGLCAATWALHHQPHAGYGRLSRLVATIELVVAAIIGSNGISVGIISAIKQTRGST